MEVSIHSKRLIKLYQTGKDPNHSLQPQIIDKFFGTIQKLKSATTIHDILADKGLHFKKLGETKASIEVYSTRLNKQFRLEMEVEWTNEPKTIGKFTITDISNHYGD